MAVSRPSPRVGILVSALVLAASLGARPVAAAYVTFNFSGTITSVTDSTNVLGGAVHLGDHYSGAVTFETTAKGSSAGSNASRYSWSPGSTSTNPLISPVGMTVQIGSYAIQTDYKNNSTYFAVTVGNNVDTTLGVKADVLEAQTSTYTGGTVFGSPLVTDLSLADRTQQVFSSTALPAAVSTSQFTDGMFGVYTYLNTSPSPVQLLAGTVDNLSPASVPEPGSLILTAAGLVGLATIRRWRTDRPATPAGPKPLRSDC